MCGRYSIVKSAEELEEGFKVKFENKDLARSQYNACPSLALPIISSAAPQLIYNYKWGLIPHWAKDKNIGYKLINARIETLAEKASFKYALKKDRCIVLADSYYEWKKMGKQKIPYRIKPQGSFFWGFAGLFTHWVSPNDGKLYKTFTIITHPSSLEIEHIHLRMPVIIPSEAKDIWLNPKLETDDSLSFLTNLASITKFDYYSISKQVNSPKNNNADIHKPFAYGFLDL